MGKPRNRKKSGKRSAAAKKPNHHSPARELLKLRREIDSDLAAGRISQSDYDLCKSRIEAELAALAKPLPPGEKLRIVGIPRKQVDWDKFARALLLHAENQLRQERGESPIDEAEVKAREVAMIQAAAEAKQQDARTEERKLQTRRRHFIRRKPAELRQETWDWLIAEELESLPADGRLGPLVFRFGIIEQPHLLRETVIQLDGRDYVIDQDAAEALADGEENVPLVRLAGQVKQSVERQKVVEALTQGAVFEQLEVEVSDSH